VKDYRNRLKSVAADEEREWFRFQNKANDVTRIDIFDEISSISSMTPKPKR
jgi:hypothetical protein